MKYSKFTRVSSALVCAVLLAGCGASDDGGGNPRSEEEALAVSDGLTVADPAVVAASDIPVFPIEKYLPKVGEDARIAAASGELIRECMAGFGFTYEPPAPSQETLDSGENGANRARRYGVSSAASAAVNGFHLPKDGLGGQQPPPGIPPMSEAENKVFIGDQDPATGVAPGDKVAGKEIPPGGCSGEAQRRLKIEPRQRMAEKINNVSFARSQENAQVKKALQEWSACMGRAGHTYKTPLDALDRLTGETPSPAELSAAKADVKCKDSVNLVGVWFAVESEIQETLIARNEEVLAQDGTSFDALVRRASEEIAKS
ncbi:hypothetical protein AB0P45_20575 [Streptomyces niveus]|uniref:hypothetical protein n=1 Tax=Streptomyces niveus TaxID=193462 RepID=UPI00343DDDBB